jgi:hypothetical protein
MKHLILSFLLLLSFQQARCWGFFAHRKINRLAVFLLPPEMLAFYKQHIDFLMEHAVDPDKRRYAVKEEGPRHYIDLDHYGKAPFDTLPRGWDAAVARFSEDSLMAHGIVPWWINRMQYRLTEAFREKDTYRILKLSAEIGHYVADAHVPLHTTANHNGQLTGQEGIHGFWESRLPELLADKEWDLLTGTADYLMHPLTYIWDRTLESAAAADSVLSLERLVNSRFPTDKKYAFEERNGQLVRSYSTSYSIAYHRLLAAMPERRMRQSILSVASFWFTAWVNAGQPTLTALVPEAMAETERSSLDSLERTWRAGKILGKSCEAP